MDVPFRDWLDATISESLLKVLRRAGRQRLNDRRVNTTRDPTLSGIAAGERKRLCCADVSAGALYSRVPYATVLGVRVNGLHHRSTSCRRHPSGRAGITDAVVLATNYHALMKWIPDEWLARDKRFAGLEQLQSVPILGAHLWFDRPVMTEPHAALPDGPLQWVFLRDQVGRVLHGLISAARDWTERASGGAALFVRQIRSTFPAARNAGGSRQIVVEKRAFHPCPVSIDTARLKRSAGWVRKLFLAATTRAGWPPRWEGAVPRRLSRRTQSFKHTVSPAWRRSFLSDDLPVEWPQHTGIFRYHRHTKYADTAARRGPTTCRTQSGSGGEIACLGNVSAQQAPRQPSNRIRPPREFAACRPASFIALGTSRCPAGRCNGWKELDHFCVVSGNLCQDAMLLQQRVTIICPNAKVQLVKHVQAIFNLMDSFDGRNRCRTSIPRTSNEKGMGAISFKRAAYWPMAAAFSTRCSCSMTCSVASAPPWPSRLAERVGVEPCSMWN